MSRHVTVSGVSLEIEETGQGRPILFLHPGEGLQPNRPWLNALARNHRVIAPHHPGFGGSSLPDYKLTINQVQINPIACSIDLENIILRTDGMSV